MLLGHPLVFYALPLQSLSLSLLQQQRAASLHWQAGFCSYTPPPLPACSEGLLELPHSLGVGIMPLCINMRLQLQDILNKVGAAGLRARSLGCLAGLRTACVCGAPYLRPRNWSPLPNCTHSDY